MTKSTAWMPVYIGDYLKDTARLTTEQHGAYLLLIFDYWVNGPLPDDDVVLQQIAKLERAAWRRHRPVIARYFQIVDGHWHHKRIEEELASAKDNQERRSSKAKKAAEARWGNASGNAPSIAQGNAQGHAPGCAPPSPSPLPTGVGNDDDGESRTRTLNAVDVAAELVRIGGVPHLNPTAINRNIETVAQWLADGFDPETEIAPVIRQEITDATGPVHSLKYFDAPLRRARARKEAKANGTSEGPRGRTGIAADRVVERIRAHQAGGGPVSV